MVLRFHQPCSLVSHPIAQLRYQTQIDRFEFEDRTLEIEHVADVEVAIDQVFAWLESQSIANSEIERLAPYFASVWPSALALAQWVAAIGSKGALRGRKVLEVGCGLGLPGILAASYGADVTLSDGHPDVPRFLQRNVELNAPLDILYAPADWTCSVRARVTQSA